MWKHKGIQRPDFAIQPEDWQESVWDYPRPPALVECDQVVEIRSGNEIIARSVAARRVLETASPPTVYIPSIDINFDYLQPTTGNSFCEWKGAAAYWALEDQPGLPAVGWSYPNPSRAFAAIANWLCFYPGRVECYLDAQRVKPQEGGFYGGWVTDAIVGPWKGAANTGHW